jgi:hypothetical protein
MLDAGVETEGVKPVTRRSCTTCAREQRTISRRGLVVAWERESRAGLSRLSLRNLFH